MYKYIRAFSFILLYLVLYYVFQIVGAVIFLVMSPGFGLGILDPFNFLTGNFAIILLISAPLSFLAFCLIYLMRRKNIFTECRLTSGSPAKSFFYGGMFGLSSSIVVSFLLTLLMLNGLFDDLFEKYNFQITSLISQGDFIYSLLGVGIIVPIVEEVMFRGIIYHELDDIFSVKTAIVLQGILFGVYHLNIIQGLYASILGIFFGLIVYKTKSIWPAIIAHIFMNSSSVVLSHPVVLEIYEKYAVGYFLVIILFFILSTKYFVNLQTESPE